VGDVLKANYSVNKLNQVWKIDVKDAWCNLMGNGVNSYTKNVVLKGRHLICGVKLFCIAKSCHGKTKIVTMINEELRT
jgi:hypothetical protein